MPSSKLNEGGWCGPAAVGWLVGARWVSSRGLISVMRFMSSSSNTKKPEWFILCLRATTAVALSPEELMVLLGIRGSGRPL